MQIDKERREPEKSRTTPRHTQCSPTTSQPEESAEDVNSKHTQTVVRQAVEDSLDAYVQDGIPSILGGPSVDSDLGGRTVTSHRTESNSGAPAMAYSCRAKNWLRHSAGPKSTRIKDTTGSSASRTSST
jgi:hypothetical protein